uniref:Putative methyltransferase n=1 Tax=viral metagenome TaxID=1070528 RepID=A0A6M3IGX8_9ZZZZ
MSDTSKIGPKENTFTEEEKKYFKTLKLVLLVPIAERPEGKFFKCVVDMMAFSWFHGLEIHETGITERTVVDWARNQLARDAIQRESPLDGKLYTHFLWIDSDMVFNPDMACQLARHQVDMVSLVYHCRSGAPLPLVYVKSDDLEGYKHHTLLDIPQMLCKVDAFGFGGCLISRKVFEGTPEPWFTVDYRAGEDIAFCKRARDFGFQPYVDGVYSAGHIGTAPVVSEKDFAKWKQDNYDTYLKDRMPVSLGGK